MLSMNAVRIINPARGVWAVQMRPCGKWEAVDGYSTIQGCISYEDAVAFLWAIMQDS